MEIKCSKIKYSNPYQTAGFHLQPVLPTAVFRFMYLRLLISLNADNICSIFISNSSKLAYSMALKTSKTSFLTVI
jgi:hypothetical protein